MSDVPETFDYGYDPSDPLVPGPAGEPVLHLHPGSQAARRLGHMHWRHDVFLPELPENERWHPLRRCRSGTCTRARPEGHLRGHMGGVRNDDPATGWALRGLGLCEIRRDRRQHPLPANSASPALRLQQVLTAPTANTIGGIAFNPSDASAIVYMCFQLGTGTAVGGSIGAYTWSEGRSGTGPSFTNGAVFASSPANFQDTPEFVLYLPDTAT